MRLDKNVDQGSKNRAIEIGITPFGVDLEPIGILKGGICYIQIGILNKTPQKVGREKMCKALIWIGLIFRIL